MAIIVNTNMTALKSQRNLTSATNSMTKSLERMSTGYKINSAKDDAAGLFVATGLETQIRGSKVAQSNATTGINVLQTIEGDLDNILTNLNRIRDLATQAANSIYSDEVMNAMGKEVEARIEEINRISKASNFNGLTLLDGDSRLEEQGLRLQIGANANPEGNSIEIGKEFFAKVDATTLGTGATVYGETIDGNDTVSSGAVKAFGDGTATNPPAASAAADYIAVLDVAINSISSKKSELGAVMNRLEAAEASLTTTIENATAAKSTIMDADIAAESAEYTKAQILQQTSSALLVQANALPQIAIQLVQG